FLRRSPSRFLATLGMTTSRRASGKPHPSYPIPHALIPHPSSLIPHPSSLMPHASCLMPLILRRPECPTRFSPSFSSPATLPHSPRRDGSRRSTVISCAPPQHRRRPALHVVS